MYFKVLSGTFSNFQVLSGSSRYFQVLSGTFWYFMLLFGTFLVPLCTFWYYRLKEANAGEYRFLQITTDYYAPPLRYEGPRLCPHRGNAGGALVFSMLLWLLYTLGVYT